MSKLDAYFQDYSSYHRTLGNQRTHALGIPMIVVAVLAWASRWQWMNSGAQELPSALLQLDFGVLIVVLASIWYCVLDWRVGLPFAPVLYAAYWLGRATPNEAAWALFILGWMLQLIGHGIFEKKSPAFTKNLRHLLIGPIWVFVKLLHLESGSHS